MGGALPLGPDYVPAAPALPSFSSSSSSTTLLAAAATSPSSLTSHAAPTPSSSFFLPHAGDSAAPSPSQLPNSDSSSFSSAYMDRHVSVDSNTERRSKRTSMDRVYPQVPAHTSSSAYSSSNSNALSSSAAPPASLPASRLSTAQTVRHAPSPEHEHRFMRSSPSSSSVGAQHVSRLPFSSSYPSTTTTTNTTNTTNTAISLSSSSSTSVGASNRGPDSTLAASHSFPSQPRQTPDIDDSVPAYTQAQLPSTPSLSSPSSRSVHSSSPSSYPSVYANSLSSRFAVPIPRSNTASHIASPSSYSSYKHPANASSPNTADMRLNLAAFDPSVPSSSFAARRDANFARFRSGSGSINSSPRSTSAGNAEIAINVLIWWPSQGKNASSTLARAPLFRDAANVKQKLSLRASASSNRAPEPGHEALFERASFGFRHGGSSWLREKPSKSRLNTPSSSVGPLGQWKRAVLLFRENASLSIFGDGNALAHTLHCGALYTSDIRCVDDSLFARPHVLAIHPRQTRAKTEVSITTRKQEAAMLNERSQCSEPIFIQFKSEEQRQYLRALLRIYVRPEIYGSPATIDAGGTHRFFRQLEITISDAKNIMPRWPSEVFDSSQEPTSANAASSTNLSRAHNFYPASPTGGLAGGSATSSEVPRSLLHHPSLRYEDQDDSPGSEPFTEDGMSGSSRAGSRSGSRPSSRLRHNAKSSVSSMHAQHDFDDNAGSGSSRPASCAASHYDNQSQASEDVNSNGDHLSGPLSGQSGANRFATLPSATSETAPSIHPSISATSGYTTASRPSNLRRIDDKNRFEKARFDRYCRIRLDGELMARTSLAHSGASAFAVDKFQLKDVGDAKSLVVEVLHPVQKSSSSLAGSPSQTAHKYILLGLVEIPIETLRRNEEVEGRFPIWSVSTFPSMSQQHPSSPPGADEDDGRAPMNFQRGIVGELSMSIRLQEGAVMPLSMYEEVFRRIHDTDAPEMVRELATTMREDLIISHLIRIYAASGTIAERIVSLIEAESVNWGEKMEPELLFRANTLLSRSVDHFQRLLALSWLDDCLGPTVRKICHDPNAPSRPDTAMSNSSAGSGGGDDAHFDFSTSIRSPPLLPANAIDAIPNGPVTTNLLRKLSETMWQNIYRQRHSCPPDLRTVFHQIRCKVNERYRSSKSTRPGIQGVGAFVFLRLFCAALNAPQLYGLTPSQPGRGAQRKLLLLSKVLLALASKKTAFDKDKDWELVPLSDLLRTYSSAYDDYISVVSTEPPTAAPVQLLGTRIEDDSELQAAAQRRLGSLSPLHREAIPKPPYMLDQPQTLASFVSFIVDAAEERESTNLYAGASGINAWAKGHQSDSTTASNNGESKAEGALSDTARIKQKTYEFVQICCRIEDAAGMCIEQAGYDPRPIPFERLQRSVMPSLSRYGGSSASSTVGSSPLRGVERGDTSIGSFSSSTSSFGTVIVPGDGGVASPRSSPSCLRSRRATVSAANARSRMADSASARDAYVERTGSDMERDSPRSSRRKSLGISRSSRRPSQSTVKASLPVYPSGVGLEQGFAAGRRIGEMSESNTMTPRQPSPARPLAPTSAASSPYRHTFSLPRGEDDHGSDDELRQAYRMLRAEEEAAVASRSRSQSIAVPSGVPIGDLSATEEPASFAVDDAETRPALGLEPMGALLEADDGSTFEPVYPQRGFASPKASSLPLSRSARQSVEFAGSGGQSSMLAMSPATATRHISQLNNTGDAAGGQSYDAQSEARGQGPRASFTAASSTRRQGGTLPSNGRSSEIEFNRRHSSDQQPVPRNYSFPHSPAGRKSSIQHEIQESSDGFGSIMEDAYAQTRASLPPLASMPVVPSSAAASAAKYSNGGNNSIESAQGSKKKKWWKP
ncbi:related to GTPase activating protein [Ustilago bromivora]|uniref:Related to GTPase activating protein n=2 Tax=Ustilago bromivora TaxID=307758 RepID=A0A8H8TRV9_9BASI|nr:related to GTPase activating protein [Ustilago bromivora]